jgi:hypothetical protein
MQPASTLALQDVFWCWSVLETLGHILVLARPCKAGHLRRQWRRRTCSSGWGQLAGTWSVGHPLCSHTAGSWLRGTAQSETFFRWPCCFILAVVRCALTRWAPSKCSGDHKDIARADEGLHGAHLFISEYCTCFRAQGSYQTRSKTVLGGVQRPSQD